MPTTKIMIENVNEQWISEVEVGGVTARRATIRSLEFDDAMVQVTEKYHELAEINDPSYKSSGGRFVSGGAGPAPDMRGATGEIGGTLVRVMMPMADIVKRAVDKAGLSAQGWNALPYEQQLAFVQTMVEVLGGKQNDVPDFAPEPDPEPIVAGPEPKPERKEVGEKPVGKAHAPKPVAKKPAAKKKGK